jgi:hypothetical protein
VLSGTALVVAADGGVKRSFSRTGMGEYRSDFWDIPTFYGGTLFMLSGSVLTYAGGLVSGSDGVRTTGRLMLASLATAEVVATLLKIRCRPGPPLHRIKPVAFPVLSGE